MLSSFLRHGLTREEAEGEALVNIIAGSDTTATAMRTTMLYLMSTPQAYRALVNEIRSADARGEISQPITDAEARQLPYLQAVIKEGLRVFPPVTGLMPTVVPAGGDVVDGVHVPEGTEIGWSAFGVQHDKGVYGEDAEAFRPERWLVEDEAALKEMLSTWELVFKYGKWQCLGRNVALMELNKVFVEVSAEVYRSWSWTIPFLWTDTNPFLGSRFCGVTMLACSTLLLRGTRSVLVSSSSHSFGVCTQNTKPPCSHRILANTLQGESNPDLMEC